MINLKNKYKNVLTFTQKRILTDIACFFTTILYGISSQYNRIKYKDIPLYKFIGFTHGYGSLQFKPETITFIYEFLKFKNHIVSSKMGNGSNWVFRVISTYCSKFLKINPNLFLKHSFQRAIYVIPTAYNYLEFLRGESSDLDYFNFTKEDLYSFWKDRWLKNRLKNQNVLEEVKKFKKDNFVIC